MTFDVTVTGRRMSDNGEYQMQMACNLPSESDVREHVERDYDWDDAATRNIVIRPKD